MLLEGYFFAAPGREEACVLGSLPPQPRDQHHRPQIFVIPTYTATKFCIMSKRGERKVFTGSTTPLESGSTIGQKNL